MEHPTEFMSETDYLTSLMPVGADSLPFEFFLNKSRLLTEKISINEYESLTFQSIETIQGKLDKAAELGLITTVGDFISVTDLGKKYLNSFLEMFL
jgi:coproporphyrinogen III oxidase-like Fe-S oxidoreductase